MINVAAPVDEPLWCQLCVFAAEHFASVLLLIEMLSR